MNERVWANLAAASRRQSGAAAGANWAAREGAGGASRRCCEGRSINHRRTRSGVKKGARDGNSNLGGADGGFLNAISVVDDVRHDDQMMSRMMMTLPPESTRVKMAGVTYFQDFQVISAGNTPEEVWP